MRAVLYRLYMRHGPLVSWIGYSCAPEREIGVHGKAPRGGLEDIRPGPSAGPELARLRPRTRIAGRDCENDPPIQVHAYNDDLYILRQSKCSHYEAPFLYLIFGEEKVLLIDTGSRNDPPVAETVLAVIEEWLERNERLNIELVVAHSHGDHVANDAQFAGIDYTTVVGVDHASVIEFWGFEDYPRDAVTFDLGGRVLDVLGTPGHEPSSVTFYDRRTELLLTGDIVYPGHLFIFSAPEWVEFRESIERLVAFAQEHPVRWVLGCHIEMTDRPGVPFRYGAEVHPAEHPLELPPGILIEVLEARDAVGATPDCRVFDEFVIHPVFVCGFPYTGE